MAKFQKKTSIIDNQVSDSIATNFASTADFAPKAKTKKEISNALQGLKPKQKKFVQEYLETGNGTLSALKAYDIAPKDKKKKENVASSIATENLRKPAIANAILALSERIPDDLLIKRHLELLNKKEYKRFNGKTIIDVDSQAVSKGLDMAYKIKNLYSEPVSKKEIEITILNAEQKKELLGLLGREVIEVESS